MVNLSECKFGDRLKTRDGRLAIFMHKLPQSNVYCLAVATTKERNDYFSAYYKKVSRKIGDFYECQYSSERHRGYGNIVGKWEGGREMKIYLSLPISGQPTKLRMAYANQVRNELTEAFWRREGIFEYESSLKVVTPFDVNENEDKDSYARKMGNDIEALLECDAIFLCEGWQNSKGCMAEFEVARIYNKQILFEK